MGASRPPNSRRTMKKMLLLIVFGVTGVCLLSWVLLVRSGLLLDRTVLNLLRARSLVLKSCTSPAAQALERTRVSHLSPGGLKCRQPSVCSGWSGLAKCRKMRTRWTGDWRKRQHGGESRSIPKFFGKEGSSGWTSLQIWRPAGLADVSVVPYADPGLPRYDDGNADVLTSGSRGPVTQASYDFS